MSEKTIQGKAEQAKPKRKKLLEIPLSALRKLRLTCPKCDTVVEYTLSEQMLSGWMNSCPRCSLLGGTPANPVPMHKDVKELLEPVLSILKLNAGLAAIGKFIIPDPGEEE